MNLEEHLKGYIPFSRRMRIEAWQRVRDHVQAMSEEELHVSDREDALAMLAALDKLIEELKAPQ